MRTRNSLLAVLGAGILGLLITASAHAVPMNIDYLTFSGPVALPNNVTLPAGTYIFRVPSHVSPDVVQVLSRNGQRALYQGMTQRLLRTGKGQEVQVTLGEARPGQAAQVRTWFPSGQREGHGFIYDR